MATPLEESIGAGMTEAVLSLVRGGVKLQCRRDALGNLEVPTQITASITHVFTIPELRKLGIPITFLNEHGRPMTDDEYVAAMQAAMAQRRPSPENPHG